MITALLLWLIPFSVFFFLGKKAKRHYSRDRLGRFSIKNVTFVTYSDMRRGMGLK